MLISLGQLTSDRVFIPRYKFGRYVPQNNEEFETSTSSGEILEIAGTNHHKGEPNLTITLHHTHNQQRNAEASWMSLKQPKDF
jgi:hypothetical protein